VSEIGAHLSGIEARDDELAAMDSQACSEAASLLRGAKHRLRTDRQRELAEELADEFDALAAQRSPST